MKVLFLILTGLIMLVGGWGAVSGVEEEFTELSDNPAATSAVEDITGRWYGFPVGLLLQFNDDGTAHFGLDWDGTAVGYAARIWFEGRLLSVVFVNYEGQKEDCASAVGSYRVQLHATGAIGFETVDDDCHFRAEILSGSAESGTGLLYHQVQN